MSLAKTNIRFVFRVYPHNKCIVGGDVLDAPPRNKSRLASLSVSQNSKNNKTHLKVFGDPIPFCKKAEIKKKTCYVFFEGFRTQKPDCAEPNGDGRVPVPSRIVRPYNEFVLWVCSKIRNKDLFWYLRANTVRPYRERDGWVKLLPQRHPRSFGGVSWWDEI